MKNSRKKHKVIMTAAAAAALAVLLAAVLIAAGSGVKARNIRRQLDLAQSYLEEMDYERAVASFLEALSIDPRNEETLQAIEACVEQLCDVGRGYGQVPDAAAEREMAGYILQLDEGNQEGRLIQAEAEYLDENYEAAMGLYDDFISSYGENEEALRNREKCQAAILIGNFKVNFLPPVEGAGFLKELLEMCEEKNWDGIVELLESGGREQLAGLLLEEGRLTCKGAVNLVIGRLGTSLYLYCGDLAGDIMEGQGLILFVRDGGYCIYEGAWEGDKPNGHGTAVSWASGAERPGLPDYEAEFADGLLNGEIPYATQEGEPVTLTVDNGKVRVSQTDKKGRVWLQEGLTETGCALVVNGVEEEDGYIKDCCLGIPEYGGNEADLQIRLTDVTPPVMKTKLEKGDSFMGGADGGKEFLVDFSAKDNIDGDLSGHIVADVSSFPKWKTGQDYQEITGDILYLVTDAEGNTSSIKVKVYADQYVEPGIDGYFHSWDILDIDLTNAEGVIE